MDSKELGLVLARQLLEVDDLHYGLWDPGLELSFANLRIAQQRYNELLMERLPQPARGVRVLDVGCGTGRFMELLLERGYLADGVVPSAALAQAARQRLARYAAPPARLFECRFEDMPEDCRQAYDVVLFSESFQYMNVPASLEVARRVLRPGGSVVICDYFKTDAHGDGGPGDKSMGGGHLLRKFREQVAQTPFEQVEDLDITTRVSPNLKLVNDTLMLKAKPALLTIARFLEDNYPKLFWVVRRLANRRLKKLEYKYFSNLRTPEMFQRYKTYRLLRYRLPAA